jgi:DHA3 family tetracycline resistance protein-like MFS transporter
VYKLKAVPVYLIFTFSMGLITSLAFLVSQIYRIQIVGLNPLQLVLVGTALEAAAFAFEIPTGVVADTYSRRLSVIVGCVIFGLGFILEGAIQLFITVLLAQVVWGLGWTFISGALDAWIADEVGVDTVGPVYIRGSQLGTVGGLVAIPLSVLLGNVAVNLPFLVGGGLFIALGLFLAVFMPEEGFTPAPPEERETFRSMVKTLGEGVGMMRARPVMLIFVAVSLTVGLASEGWDRLNDAHLLEHFTFPTWGDMTVVTWFGIFGAVSGILGLIVKEIIKRKLDTTNQLSLGRALQVTALLIAAGVLVFAWTDSFALAVLMTWLVGISRSVSYPLEAAWMNQYIDSKVRATVLSMTNQVNALGQILGGPGVGYIGNRFSLPSALSISGVLFAVPFWLYGLAVRRKESVLDVSEEVV